MKPESYIKYLEVLVLSLLEEREEPLADIQLVHTNHLSLINGHASPIGAYEAIAEARAERGDTSEPSVRDISHRKWKQYQQDKDFSVLQALPKHVPEEIEIP